MAEPCGGMAFLNREIKAAKKRGGGYINPAEKTYKKAANLGDHNHYSYTQQRGLACQLLVGVLLLENENAITDISTIPSFSGKSLAAHFFWNFYKG